MDCFSWVPSSEDYSASFEDRIEVLVAQASRAVAWAQCC